MSMRILVFEPGITYPKIQHIDGTLESMRRIVGGYVEPIYVPECGPDAVLLVNEEGRLNGLAPNRTVNGHPIFGTFLLCKRSREELVGLSIKEAIELRETCVVWPMAMSCA